MADDERSVHPKKLRLKLRFPPQIEIIQSIPKPTVSNGNVNIYIERVSADIGEHKSKVSAVIKFNSLQSEFTTGLVFV